MNIAAGPDGNVWFTETDGGSSLSDRPHHAHRHHHRVPPADGGSSPSASAGPDGNVWFTDTGRNAIGRVTPTASHGILRARRQLIYAQWGAPRGWMTTYDGDGRADVAVYRAATGEWFVLRSSDAELVYGSWGAPSSIALGDVPVPGDYDADGRADLAVYRQTSGQWFILNSSNGSPIIWQWGGPSLGDVPVAARY